MPMSRLELTSSRGDQTLSKVRFVLHGASNAREFDSILEGGLKFIEGRPMVSTNLVHAQDWTVNPSKQVQSLGAGAVAGEPGSVLVCAVPSNFHLGYGVFTTAYIDRALHRVMGAPRRYASARKQLAFYMSAEVEAARAHIEQEVANGYTLAQRPQFNLDPQYVVGSFELAGGFDVLVTQLDVAIGSLQQIDHERLQSSLASVFRPRVEANAVLVPTAMRDIILGTAESIIISRLRMMRWQGLAMLGYTFTEGREAVEMKGPADIAEQRQLIDEFGRRLASSSLFSAELAWLKIYASQQLELMRVELDGAELEALPD